jgi:hypothetical protein
MSKKTSEAEKPGKIPDPKPPSSMTRPEKRLFLSLVEARKALGRPILSGEQEILTDLVLVRSRAATLAKKADAAWSQAGPNIAIQRHAASLMRQADGAVALARRLTKDLGLLGAE